MVTSIVRDNSATVEPGYLPQVAVVLFDFGLQPVKGRATRQAS